MISGIDNYVLLMQQWYFIFVFYRLILIAEKDTVYEKFPTPLINRLEKHFVLTSSVLKEWQNALLKEFEDWVIKFCKPGYACRGSSMLTQVVVCLHR